MDTLIHVLGQGTGERIPQVVDIASEIRLFAGDCVCYREIKNEEDTLKLQRDIDRLGSWARKWGMRFQPVKCNMMQLTNKRSSKIQANYTLEGTVLENVESIKYLGVFEMEYSLEKVHQDLFHSVYFEYDENCTHGRLLYAYYALC